MMHVMYNAGFTAIDVASKILNFLKANYLVLQYEVMEKLLKYLLEPSPRKNGMVWFNHAFL